MIPAKDFNKLMPGTPLRKVKRKLYGYERQPLKVIGYWALTSRYKDKAKMLKFYVVDCNTPPILGFKACKALGLIKVVYAISATSNEEPTNQLTNILSEYSDVFKGIGTFQGKCSFRIHSSVVPVVCPPRRMPFAPRKQCEQEERNVSVARANTTTKLPDSYRRPKPVIDRPPGGIDDTFSEHGTTHLRPPYSSRRLTGTPRPLERRHHGAGSSWILLSPSTEQDVDISLNQGRSLT